MVSRRVHDPVGCAYAEYGRKPNVQPWVMQKHAELFPADQTITCHPRGVWCLWHMPLGYHIMGHLHEWSWMWMHPFGHCGNTSWWAENNRSIKKIHYISPDFHLDTVYICISWCTARHAEVEHRWKHVQGECSAVSAEPPEASKVMKNRFNFCAYASACFCFRFIIYLNKSYKSEQQCQASVACFKSVAIGKITSCSCDASCAHSH